MDHTRFHAFGAWFFLGLHFGLSSPGVCVVGLTVAVTKNFSLRFSGHFPGGPGLERLHSGFYRS